MYIYIFKALCDSAKPWQYGYQDPATPIIRGIIHLHNNIIFYLIIILCLVCWLLFRAIFKFRAEKNKFSYKDFTHSTPLEIGWTLSPALLLILLSGPSFSLLYAIDEVANPEITIKVVGHQWYWSYEYTDACKTDGESIIFDSYILNSDDLTLGILRLLEVDNRLVLPTNTHIRVIITSADVLHSWCVPSLGVKIDACPGRLNMVSMYIDRLGVFYGQCSEICGVNHGFIPIVVHTILPESYTSFIQASLQDSSFPSSKIEYSSIVDVDKTNWERFLPYLKVVGSVLAVTGVGFAIWYFSGGSTPPSPGSFDVFDVGVSELNSQSMANSSPALDEFTEGLNAYRAKSHENYLAYKSKIK